MDSQKGQTLVEIIVTAAIIGVMSSVATSVALTVRRQLVIRAVATELRSALAEIRALAIARNRSLGLKFRQTGSTWGYETYEDGDGDGVRNDDILKGRDRLIRPARRLFAGGVARIGLPSFPVTDPSSLAPLQGTAAIRFGSSTICSFSRRGEATSGSIYLTDGTRVLVIRVYGGTGHIRTLRFERKTGKWIA